VVPIITTKLLDTFDCILMLIQFLRICNLIALLCLYLVLDDIRNNDTIGQPLLTNQNTTSYRATAATSNNATSAKQDNKIDVEQLLDDVWLSKRLIKAKNWWNYAKEFKVSSCHFDVFTLLMMYRFFSCTSGLSIA
jgi:hypothetical protein